MEAERASREVQRLAREYRELFFRHSDLTVRFNNILIFGKYYHWKATGELPAPEYLQAIEEAQSARERELRAQVVALRAELDRLRAQPPPPAGPEPGKVRQSFIDALRDA